MSNTQLAELRKRLYLAPGPQVGMICAQQERRLCQTASVQCWSQGQRCRRDLYFRPHLSLSATSSGFRWVRHSTAQHITAHDHSWGFYDTQPMKVLTVWMKTSLVGQTLPLCFTLCKTLSWHTVRGQMLVISQRKAKLMERCLTVLEPNVILSGNTRWR